MQIKLYTVCFLEKENEILMLHRNKKENDANKDKWIGVGGKFELAETPYECAKREIYEETGYIVNKLEFRGLTTYIYDNEIQYIYVFSSEDFYGEMVEDCNEGTLHWVKREDVKNKEIWPCDYEYMQRISTGDKRVFFIKSDYRGNEFNKVKEIW